MGNYVKDVDIPTVLIDSIRNFTIENIAKLSDAELAECLKVYRCNTQVAAMMANTGEVLLIPDNCQSSYAGKPLKKSTYNAWSEIYRAAVSEFEYRRLMQIRRN